MLIITNILAILNDNKVEYQTQNQVLFGLRMDKEEHVKVNYIKQNIVVIFVLIVVFVQ